MQNFRELSKTVLSLVNLVRFGLLCGIVRLVEVDSASCTLSTSCLEDARVASTLAFYSRDTSQAFASYVRHL